MQSSSSSSFWALVAIAAIESTAGFSVAPASPVGSNARGVGLRAAAGGSRAARGGSIGALTRTRMASSPLKPPPGKKGGFLRGLKESISYIVDGDKFVRDYTEEFGPIWSASIFFRPTVVVGGPKAVGEFLEKEKGIAYSSLPAPLQKLMTGLNVLLQTGEQHKQSRKNIAPLLSADSLNAYIPTIEKRVDEYLDGIEARGETALAKDFTSFCLQLFAELFSGDPLTEEEERLFVEYNAGLFSLTTFEPGFKKAKRAREILETNIQKRFEEARDSGRLDDPKYLAPRLLYQGLDEEGKPFTSYRVGYGVTQFIWGAYIETASLMSSAIMALRERPQVAEAALNEAVSAGVLNNGADLAKWSLPYNTGILRECLRTLPPAGGGFRLSSEPLEIMGYDIPVGTVVTADPRIGNLDPTIFPDPLEFAPERWATSEAVAVSKCPMSKLVGQATSLPRGAWFPGGTGQHQCPGVPLAELTTRIMVTKWVERFSSWEEVNGPPEFIPVPIKIPKDSYQVKVVKRSKVPATASS